MNLEVPSPAVCPILVLPVGDFGRAAAKHLKRLLPQIEVFEEGVQGCLSRLASDSSAKAVLVSWRPMPVISDAIDARAYRTGTATCSLILKDHEMVMGPLVIPGATCCWRCWDTRVYLAEPHARIQAAKRSFYAENLESGPRGYLPSLVPLGAAQLAKTLGDLQTNAQQAGMVVRTDLFTRQVNSEEAIGFDNCDRCGQRRPLDSRGYAGIKMSLNSLWSTDNGREAR